MYENFRNQWWGLKLKNLLWKVATVYRKEEYEETMKLYEKECKVGHACLVLPGKEMWTRSHFLINSKCDLFVQ